MSFLTRMFRAPDPPFVPEERNVSISDPQALMLFGAIPSVTGVHVDEFTALGLSAVWRCVQIIGGGVATLPLRALRDENGITERVPSWLDNPGFNQTPFELIETTMAHLLLHGNAYLIHVYGGAGQLISVSPVHPMAVGIDVDKQGRKTYRVTLCDGTTKVFDDTTLTHIKGLSLDGIRGLSPLTLARNGAFGTAIAADRTAAKMFGNGMLATAIASFEDSVGLEEAQVIQDSLNRAVAGVENAGQVALINRKVNIAPWQLSPEDAQWIQSRQFQKSEIATWFGVPDSLVGLSEKQSSWGTGIAEMHKAMASWTFKLSTTRIEQRLSLLLPPTIKAEFDYRALLDPSPEAKIALLLQQTGRPILTVNEARKILNLPPIEGGDVLATTPQGNTPPQGVVA
jgi:HK97 family phage portal protein